MPPPPRPYRLLFVISQLHQGGAERWLYEVIRALDRKRFGPEILTGREVGPRHHYFDLIRAEHVPIHRRLARRSLVRWTAHRSGPGRYGRWLPSVVGGLRLGRRFVNEFDLVCPVQVENWYHTLGLADPRRVIIHLMSNSIQNTYDVYAPLRNAGRFRFVLFNEDQHKDLGDIDHESCLFPLSLDLRDRPHLPVTSADGPLRIGIFTRISSEKPLEPFFYAYQSMIRSIDASLHIYGSGDPALYARTLQLLGIEDRVSFHGHAPDIASALTRDRIHLSWLLSIDDAVGYASLEIGSLGIPMVFWNLGKKTHAEILEISQGAIVSYDNVVDFVAYNLRLAEDENSRREAGLRIREWTLKRHDMGANVSMLESFYEQAVSPGELPRNDDRQGAADFRQDARCM